MPAGCRMPAHNRPNIRVSSPRTAKSRSRKTRVRQSWNTLLRRVSRWRGASLVRRTLTAAPRAVRIVCLAALVLAAFSLKTLFYHVAGKPSELLFFVGSALDKEPIETWRRYEPLFHTYSTSPITPELLAALAQVDSAGNRGAAARYCLRGTAGVDCACGFIGLYPRAVPSHAIELAAVYLDRNVAAVLA